MSRYRARIDDNQTKIVEALRSIGATVQSLAGVGKGCPDLVVGFRSVNYLMEIKDGAKVPSARKLTPDEAEWHDLWRGEVYVVKSVTQALIVIGAFVETVKG